MHATSAPLLDPLSPLLHSAPPPQLHADPCGASKVRACNHCQSAYLRLNGLADKSWHAVVVPAEDAHELRATSIELEIGGPPRVARELLHEGCIVVEVVPLITSPLLQMVEGGERAVLVCDGDGQGRQHLRLRPVLEDARHHHRRGLTGAP